MFSEACSMDKVDHDHSRLIAFYVNRISVPMGSKIRKVGRYRRLRSAGQKVSEHQLARLEIFAQVSDNADYVKALFIFRPLMTLYRGVAGGD